MRNIFLFPGSMSVQDYNRLSDAVAGYNIIGFFPQGVYKKFKYDYESFGLKALTEHFIGDGKDLGHDDLKRANEYIFSDSRTYFLMERLFKNKKENSAFNKSVDLQILIANSLYLLKKYKPEKLVFPTTPHSLVWFMAKCAEFLDISIISTPVSPLPWKRFIVRGLDNLEVIEIDSNETNNGLIVEWREKFRLSYEEAIPDYERKRKEKFKGKESSIYRNILDVFYVKSLSQLYHKTSNFRQKITSIKLYNEYTKSFKFPEKFVVIFLHFQPERTSLPEGLQYSQQFRMVIELLSLLPTDVKILVKEHPSMFRNKFDKRFRESSFYKRLNELRNVSLVPLEVDNFELLDKAAGVVTLTGTVAFEAVHRHVPVLSFGIPNYKDMPGVYLAGNQNELKEFIQNTFNEIIYIENRELKNYFNKIDEVSFFLDGDEYDSLSLKAMINAIEC